MACMDWHICVTSGKAAPFEVQQVAVEFRVERGQLIKHWPSALHTNSQYHNPIPSFFGHFAPYLLIRPQLS